MRYLINIAYKYYKIIYYSKVLQDQYHFYPDNYNDMKIYIFLLWKWQ